MFLKAEESLEDLNFQHSHFPTSARRDIEHDHYEAITVFNDGDFRAGPGKKFEPLEELLQAAWAILLRSYLQDDMVSFAVLSACQNAGYSNQQNKKISLSEDSEISVLQYHIHEKCLLKDIHAATCWKSTSQVLNGTQINTAVNFWSSLSLRNGNRNMGLSQLIDAHLEIPINDVSSSHISYKVSHGGFLDIRAIRKSPQMLAPKSVLKEWR